ncbi:MAG TPA: Crp/Fnr family transcriptional regulator [Candidatus Binatia bacterium]|nr:Crp/Fnr family transcriptional regulator [Candidatus Binatia bacterium]
MVAKTPVKVVNRLIAGLPAAERKRVLAACEPVELVFGTILCEPDVPVRDVYFPLSGFISLVAVVSAHPPLEMGLIGSEGMLGATVVLGVPDAPLRAVVQGTGSALRMGIAQFRRELRRNPVLLRTLNRYLYVLMAQLSQTAACTRFHEVEARLARWLLMTHDRCHADHFHLTHEFLADMLGVRRSGVTIAAGLLQGRNLIGYTRGEITVMDRDGLEAASCECYRAVIHDYARLLK